MKQSRKHIKEQIRVVEAFLRDWDPIGVIESLKEAGHPPDEYDSYAPYILGMLQRGATEAEVAAHLTYCRTRAMGLDGRDDGDRNTAERIMRWWQEEQSGA